MPRRLSIIASNSGDNSAAPASTSSISRFNLSRIAGETVGQSSRAAANSSGTYRVHAATHSNSDRTVGTSAVEHAAGHVRHATTRSALQ